jgi:hypothetical protein
MRCPCAALNKVVFEELLCFRSRSSRRRGRGSAHYDGRLGVVFKHHEQGSDIVFAVKHVYSVQNEFLHGFAAHGVRHRFGRRTRFGAQIGRVLELVLPLFAQSSGRETHRLIRRHHRKQACIAFQFIHSHATQRNAQSQPCKADEPKGRREKGEGGWHRPSQASSRNWSCAVIVNFAMSGCAVTPKRLRERSPNERVTPNRPFTRPSYAPTHHHHHHHHQHSTAQHSVERRALSEQALSAAHRRERGEGRVTSMVPPACSMRCRSAAKTGVCSCDTRTARTALSASLALAPTACAPPPPPLALLWSLEAALCFFFVLSFLSGALERANTACNATQPKALPYIGAAQSRAEQSRRRQGVVVQGRAVQCDAVPCSHRRMQSTRFVR